MLFLSFFLDLTQRVQRKYPLLCKYIYICFCVFYLAYYQTQSNVRIKILQVIIGFFI